jgi:diketogulonate reductase-like aldo/keto reductase
MKSRREYLRDWALTGIVSQFPSLLNAKEASVTKEAALFAKIPSSGEELFRIGLGTYKTFDVGNDSAARKDLTDVLKAFHEAGGRMIDSSPMYGTSEAVVGDLSEALKLKPPLFTATKVWTSGSAAGKREMAESMKKMKTSKLDLMQIHNLVDWKIHLPELRRMKAEGLIRYIGITHYTASAFADMEKILKAEPMDFIQIPYSIAENAAEKSLIPLARDKKVAVIANEPFAHGDLFRMVKGKEIPAWAPELGIKSWAQFFLKYIIADDAVQFAIPATRKVEHLVDNMAAGRGALPNREQRARMRRELNF